MNILPAPHATQWHQDGLTGPVHFGSAIKKGDQSQFSGTLCLRCLDFSGALCHRGLYLKPVHKKSPDALLRRALDGRALSGEFYMLMLVNMTLASPSASDAR